MSAGYFVQLENDNNKMKAYINIIYIKKAAAEHPGDEGWGRSTGKRQQKSSETTDNIFEKS